MKLIGHRGAAFYEPENTLRSIRKAIKLGVNAVEIDVHLSKDKKLVIIHDNKVDRTTNGKGYVKYLNFKALRKLDAGEGEQIPTLQEVIDLFADKVELFIELKGLGTARHVVKALSENKIEDRVYVISFWHGIVKKVKEINKKIKTGILFVGCPLNANTLIRGVNADALAINYKYINKKLVEDAHKENLKVFVWNIDDKEEIRPIAKLGVDGIGSNKPDILVDYFG